MKGPHFIKVCLGKFGGRQIFWDMKYDLRNRVTTSSAVLNTAH